MLTFIILAIVGTVVAIILYQLILQKYYWGPSGPPSKQGRDKGRRGNSGAR